MHTVIIVCTYQYNIGHLLGVSRSNAAWLEGEDRNRRNGKRKERESVHLKNSHAFL